MSIMSLTTITRTQPANTTLCDAFVSTVGAAENPFLVSQAFLCTPTATASAATQTGTSQIIARSAAPASTQHSEATSETTNSHGNLTTPFQTSAGSPILSFVDPALATSSGNSTTGAITHKKSLEGGAVAGVAVGMLLAGALIAGLIFFFLLRRQKRKQAMSAAAYSRQRASYADQNTGPEKGVTVVTAPVGSIDDLLPQPAEDDAITGDLSKIRDNIKNHVRTYYHSGPVSTADINEVGVRDIAALTGTSAAVLVKALEDPLTRDNALRSLVSSVILTRCTGERSPSLLPNDVAALSASIPASTGTNCKSDLCAQRMQANIVAQPNRPCTVNGKS